MSQTLGPYAVLGTLGKGGMGVVYRAASPEGGAQIAVKTTHHASPEEVARIRSEIQALASIRHPGIVQFLAHGVQEGVPWYAMELLEGTTLRGFVNELWPEEEAAPLIAGAWTGPETYGGEDLLPREPSMETWIEGGAREEQATPAAVPVSRRDKPMAANGRLGEVLTICHRLCAPLSVMHARGLVHRDLKPENVILRGGSPVLMDLGLVAHAGGSIGREKLEESGRVLGTLAYMAPEQAEGASVDARADLYALGAMMYELITGVHSVQMGSTSEVLRRIKTEMPPLPSTRVTGVPPALDDLVMRLLARSPAQRFGHADDVAEALVDVGATATPGDMTPTSAYLYRPALRGRVELRRRLVERIDDLKAGSGGVVVISGESGAGKTFLAIEAASLAGRRRVGMVTGECLPIGAGEEGSEDVVGAPLHPFRRFLEGCADRCRDQRAEYVEQLLGSRARILAPYESALASTQSYARHAAPEAVEGESVRERVVVALRETLAAWVAAEGPLMLLLDDWQWADELSFAALRSIDAEFLAHTPLLIVCTWRSDEIGPEHERFSELRHVTMLHLPRLDRTAVGEMVGDMLAISDPPAELVDFLTKETEGNPFFIAEYLRMAASEQILRRERGRWVLSLGGDVSRLPAPGSLQALVSRRIAGLSEPATRVLEVASVLGRHVRGVTLIGAVEREGFLGALAELESRQILEVEEGGWKFVHDKLREAAFARVPDERRPGLHAAAARALEASREGGSDDAFEWAGLARHWKEAGDHAAAMRAWARAGDQATRNFSTGEAKEAYRAALGLARAEGTAGAPEAQKGATEIELARWESGLADACLLSGETRTGMAHAGAALGHAGFPLPQSKPGWFFGFLGQFMLRVIQAYLPGPFQERATDRQERTTLAARSSQHLLEPYFLANMPLQGLFVGLRCINLGERVPDKVPLACGLGFMSMLLGATPLRPVADRWAARAVKLAEESGKRDALVYVLNRSTCYHLAMGRWDDVVRNSVRARDMAAEIGFRRGFEEAHTVWDFALHATGRLAEALEVQQTLIAAASKRGDKETLAMGLVKYIENMVKRGRTEEALAGYAAALPDMTVHGEGLQAYFHGVAAEAYLQSGDPARARTIADQAMALLKKTPPTSFFSVPGLIAAAHAYLGLNARGSDAGALPGALAMSKWLTSMAGMYPYATPASLRVAGEVSVARGRARAGVRLMERAVASAQELGMPIEQAYAHLALARHGAAEERTRHASSGERLLAAAGARDWYTAVPKPAAIDR